ncbi:MAG: hypothetical protein ACQEXJ_22925 [Myxococcota bacterium]
MSRVDVHRHLAPERTRPDIEWSVALGSGEISASRFVIHGLPEREIVAFLEARDHDAEEALRTLREIAGEPAATAVGVDGLRTKLYWFLRAEDPHLVRLDLHPVRAPVLKRYVLLWPDRAEDAFGLVHPALHEHLRWLLDRPFPAAGGLAHLSILRGEPEATGCPVVHASLAPDPEGLLAHDPALRRADLVRGLLERLSLGHHLEVVSERLLSPPMAWTSCVTLGLRVEEEVGAIVHARADPVVRGERGMSIVTPGPFGESTRPVSLAFRLAARPEVEFRLGHADPRGEAEAVGAWRLDHRVGEEAAPPDDAVLETGRTVAERAARAGTPLRPLAALAALRAEGEVACADVALQDVPRI